MLSLLLSVSLAEKITSLPGLPKELSNVNMFYYLIRQLICQVFWLHQCERHTWAPHVLLVHREPRLTFSRSCGVVAKWRAGLLISVRIFEFPD